MRWSAENGGVVEAHRVAPGRRFGPADDEALTKLATSEPEVAHLVKLRYFSGLTLQEAAAVLGVTSRTASSYWAYARVWIQAEIRRGEGEGEGEGRGGVAVAK